LADDHTMFRQGLKEMLSTDEGIEVVGEAENGAEAVALAQDLKPDVVVLDVEMPVMGAAEAMDRLLMLSPAPSIVVVAMHDDPRLVREFLGHGASAYLVKSASLEELLTAVRTAAEGPTEAYDENVGHGRPKGGLPARGEGVRGRRSLRPGARDPAAHRPGTLQSPDLKHPERSRGDCQAPPGNLYPKMGVGSRGEATRKALSEGWISARDVTGAGERTG
jgi:CheY-like chemotaxis protein